jgi:hypothetical protein
MAILDSLGFDRIHTDKVQRVPMLVLGAGNDAQCSARRIHQTATVYGTAAELFPTWPTT